MTEVRITPLITEFKATKHDDAVLDKVATFWRHCSKSSGANPGDIFVTWRRIIAKYQQELVDALDRNDRTRLKAMLGTFWRQPFSQGFAQGEQNFESLKKRLEAGDTARTEVWGSQIQVLAEAVGATLAQGPKAARAQLHPPSHVELLAGIERTTGVPIGVQEHNGGLYCFMVNGRTMFRKDFEAFVLAYGASQLRAGDGVCEIGAGAGHSAYYHHKFGAKKVFLFDLPSVAVVAIWFLGRLEGPETICVFGEGPTERTRYFFYPHFMFDKAPADIVKFDVLVNKNSFPEMGEEIAANYISKSQRFGCRKVFSSNYESDAHVGQLGKDQRLGLVWKAAQRAGWRRIARSPSWITKGNVEEIFVAPGVL